ncbi:hypothetical protein ES703_117422 [subsurface metagenome]
MNVLLKNPCRECDHHLAGGDKSVRKCTNCEKRIAYVNAIGICPSESVNIDLEDRTTSARHNDTLIILDELDKMENQKPIANQQSTIDNPIEDHIKSICQDAGITVEQIRANAKDIQDKQALQLFHETRDRIIRSLASGDFGRLSQTKIAKYLNISNHVVSTRMKIIGIAPMYPSGAQTVSKKKKSKTPDPVKPIKDKKTPESAQLTLRLDFTDLPEIYDDLKALAIQELRTVDNQALYIFKQLHDRGLNIKEL